MKVFGTAKSWYKLQRWTLTCYCKRLEVS